MSKFRNNGSISQILIHSETRTKSGATCLQSFAQMTVTVMLFVMQITENNLRFCPKVFKPQAERPIGFAQTNAIKSFLQVVNTLNSIKIF